MSASAAILPFWAKFITYEELMEERRKQLYIDANNVNPYDWQFAHKWNMQNCSQWLSPYERPWGGKYYIEYHDTSYGLQ